MPIVSASRRTDIPAFYAEWFMNRVREGYVLYPLPWSDKLKYLELTAETVDCIVFWSKNYTKLIPHLPELDRKGFKYYFHFTINNYPEHLEKFVVSTEDAVEQAKILVEKTSPDHLLWRYDPIITTRDMKSNFHLYNFEKIAAELKGYTNRCYFEFVDMYKKVERNFKDKTIPYIPFSEEQKLALVNNMAKVAAKYDMKLYSCCNDNLITGSVIKAHCIDGDLVNKLTGLKNKYPAGPTREDCGCAKSIDIGEYGSCLHGCLYCYANESRESAQKFFKQTDINAAAIDTRKLNKFENLNLARSTKKEDGQLKLF